MPGPQSIPVRQNNYPKGKGMARELLCTDFGTKL